MRNVEELVRILGSNAGVLSVDEKAKCPLRLPAVSKTTLNVMQREAPAVTADHSFSMGKGQSITPTVICGVNYDGKTKIGPMFAALRSSKYNPAGPFTRFVGYIKITYNICLD